MNKVIPIKVKCRVCEGTGISEIKKKNMICHTIREQILCSSCSGTGVYKRGYIQVHNDMAFMTDTLK